MPRVCNQGTSWSSSCGWTEKLCSQHLSQVDVYRLISYVLGVVHWKKEIVTTLQVQLSIGVWVQLLVGISRAVHGSGRVGLGPDPDSTRLDWVMENETCNQPNIWVRPGGSGQRLNGSDSSVRRVWAEIGLNFWICIIFFFNLIFYRPFGPKLMGLLLTKTNISLNYVYISYGPLFTSFISNWAFKLNLYAISPLHNFESFGLPSLISPNLIF